MVEEIKEILDDLGNKDNYIEEFGYQYKRISLYDSFQLLDYITNLQQENEKLKYNARGQVNDYFKDKYTDEVLKKAELQQENERLNNKIKEQNLLLIEFQDMEQKVEDYKSRCEKAVKYIKSTNCYGMRSGKTLLQWYLYELIDILNGSDENE